MSLLVNYATRSLERIVNPGTVRSLWISLGKSPSWSTRLTKKCLGLLALQKLGAGLNPYYWASYFMLEVANIDLGQSRWHHNLELVLEVWSAIHLNHIIESTVETQKSLNKTLRALRSLESVPKPSYLPPLYIMTTKVNELQSEGRTVSEVVRDRDYLSIIHLHMNWLPDPRSVLSKRVANRQKSNPTMNKIIATSKSFSTEWQRDIPYIGD
jgi:hypothetical protein